MKEFLFVGKKTRGTILATNYKEACSIISKIMFRPKFISIEGGSVTLGETITVLKKG